MKLSPRETEVLSLMAEGLTSREIAEHLGTGPETVKTQTRMVLRKLQARNRAHAVAISLREGAPV